MMNVETPLACKKMRSKHDSIVNFMVDRFVSVGKTTGADKKG